jgi:hypothetical protein
LSFAGVIINFSARFQRATHGLSIAICLVYEILIFKKAIEWLENKKARDRELAFIVSNGSIGI